MSDDFEFGSDIYLMMSDIHDVITYGKDVLRRKQLNVIEMNTGRYSALP
jgi:hypothetical protein